ncbi:hypothetical protein D3C72_636130 [compost metagenome]
MESFSQNAVPTSPCDIPTTTAKTRRERTSVIMVPPTVTLTARFLAIPKLLIIGYTIKVCDENKLAKSTEVSNEKPKI